MEFQWHGKKARNGRSTVKAPVLHKWEIQKDLFLAELEVGGKLARDLRRAGSFVFLRGDTENHFFDIPIAVVNSDEARGVIVVAIAVRGPKTKLINQNHTCMFVRGPYWNGLFGYRFIERTRHSKCLIVLGGISQASGALVANQMLNNANEVSVLINSQDTVFIAGYLNQTIKIYREAAFSAGWIGLIKNMIKNHGVSCLYSGGNNKQHQLLGAFSAESERRVNLATSNNNIMQCGEGICGSCAQEGNDGKPKRRCKTQMPMERLPT